MRPLPPALQALWIDSRPVSEVPATERILWRFPDGDSFINREELERRLRFRLPLLASKIRTRGSAHLDAAFRMRIFVLCECTARVASTWSTRIESVITSIEGLHTKWPNAEVVWIWVGERVRTYGAQTEPPYTPRWEGSNRRNASLLHVARLSEAWLGQGTLNGCAIVLAQPGCDSVEPRLYQQALGAMYALFATGRVTVEGIVAADLSALKDLWPDVRPSEEGEPSPTYPRPGGSHKILELQRCSHFVFDSTPDRADFHQLVVPTRLDPNDPVVVEYRKEFYHGPVWVKAGLTGRESIVAPPAIPGYRWYVRSDQPLVPMAKHIKTIQEL